MSKRGERIITFMAVLVESAPTHTTTQEGRSKLIDTEENQLDLAAVKKGQRAMWDEANYSGIGSRILIVSELRHARSSPS